MAPRAVVSRTGRAWVPCHWNGNGTLTNGLVLLSGVGVMQLPENTLVQN